jgi:hypothetical protein
MRRTTGFAAGGISITPIAAMLEAVQRAGGEWTLPCGGRTGRQCFRGGPCDNWTTREKLAV